MYGSSNSRSYVIPGGSELYDHLRPLSKIEQIVTMTQQAAKIADLAGMPT